GPIVDDLSTPRLHASRAQSLELEQDVLDVLRIAALGEAGGIHHVAEQDRELPALASSVEGVLHGRTRSRGWDAAGRGPRDRIIPANPIPHRRPADAPRCSRRRSPAPAAPPG